MSKKSKNLLAAAGWLALSGILTLAALDHATCDASEFEGRAIGRWARIRNGLYKLAGRRGIVALDIGFVAVGLCLAVGALRRGLRKEGPPVMLPDDVLARARTSVEQATCASCNAAARGIPTAIPEEATTLDGAVGYLCKTCGALICTDCAEHRIGWSRWDGWARKTCPVCGRTFDPQTAIVGS